VKQAKLKSPGARWLRVRQLDETAKKVRHLKEAAETPKGWVREIREALGMTTTTLARRLNVTQPAIAQLESQERRGGVSLNKLRKAAAALNCDLVYVFLPRASLEQAVNERIRAIAHERTSRVNQTMTLEAQAADPKLLARQEADLAETLRVNLPSNLWERE
jgi:predicted DNA-binding mobile mystery protein A